MRAITGLALTVIAFNFAVGLQIGSQPESDLYHSSEDIKALLRDVATKKPDKARFEDVMDQKAALTLPILTITDFETGIANKELIVLVAGEHAKELITSEIVLWLSFLLTGHNDEELLEWTALQPIQATAWKSGWTEGTLSEWAERLLKKVVFKIFPIQNIAGRKAVENEKKCLRKTLTGVDLNRNWPIAWTKSAEGSDEYGGSKPFSEPETRIVNNVLASQPQAFVNLHSGEWAMYTPWDSKAEAAENLPADINELMEKMNTYCECMKGPAGKVAGYLAMGSSMDFMYAQRHVSYPLTFEVYGPSGLGKLANGGHPRRLQEDSATNASSFSEAEEALPAVKHQQRKLQQTALDNCLSQFNPMTREDYESTVASWIGSLLVLAEHVASHPQPAVANEEASQEQLPEPKARPYEQDLVTMGEEAMRKAYDNVLQKEFKVDLGRRGAVVAERLDPESEQTSPEHLPKSYWVYGGVVGILFVTAAVLWRRQSRFSGKLRNIRR